MAISSSISVFSYPKVNLALDILRRDPSGYHEIQTVYHQLDAPADEIFLEERNDGKISVECDNPKIPTDKTNTVLKAALLLKKYTSLNRGAKIFIRKKIPVMSGLGGGASNAVAALKGLAKLWGILCCHSREGGDLHEDNCILRRIADQIGMDCAFFFMNKFDLVPAGNPQDPARAAVSRSRRALAGGTALGTHFGEKITPLPPLPPEIKFEIIETSVEISSHDAYSWIDLRLCGKNTHKTERLIEAIRAQDAKGILENLHNDFEPFIFKRFPFLQSKITNRQSPITNYIHLTGSGGALFYSAASAQC